MGSSSKNQTITEFVGRLKKEANFEIFLGSLANLKALYVLIVVASGNLRGDNYLDWLHGQ